jgi:hypothetical protein
MTGSSEAIDLKGLTRNEAYKIERSLVTRESGNRGAHGFRRSPWTPAFARVTSNSLILCVSYRVRIKGLARRGGFAPR